MLRKNSKKKRSDRPERRSSGDTLYSRNIGYDHRDNDKIYQESCQSGRVSSRDRFYISDTATKKTERNRKNVSKKKKKNANKTSVDFWLIALVILLTLFGVVMVSSAGSYWSIDNYGSPYFFLIRDMFWAGTGFLIMIFFAIFDYHRLKGKVAIGLLIASFLTLIMVLTPLGVNINGANRWVKLGPITMMPGEFAKFAIIVFVSWYFADNPVRIKSPTRGLIPMLVLCGVYGGLIMLQPNMSTAMTVVAIIMAIMFVAGLRYIYFGILIGGGIGSALMLIFTNPDGYRAKRAVSFLDPFNSAQGDGWQVVNSLLALGSGGLTGLGLGKSVQKNLYLPEPQNDFILAIIGEELGYIGILILMIIYILTIWRGVKIAMGAGDRFGMLLASGVTAMLGIQVILNVAVVTSSMPPTGVTLPFISYGGNAMWLFMASAGVLLSVSRQQVSEGEEK